MQVRNPFALPGLHCGARPLRHARARRVTTCEHRRLPCDHLTIRVATCQIFVKTLTGRKQQFDFEPSQTVGRRRHGAARARRAARGVATCRAHAAVSTTPAPAAAAIAQIVQIKEALQEKEGIDVKQIRLISSGKQL